jgi:Icc-related predicted phosphoesterase
VRVLRAPHWFAAFVRVVCAFACVAVAPGCASDPPPKPAPPPPKPVETKPVEEETPELPRTLDEVSKIIGHKCPGPIYTLKEPGTLDVRGLRLRVEGSTAVREGGKWKGPLKIGVLGAPKDAEPETAANVRKANAAFKKAGAQLILVNGDLADSAEIAAVAQMVAKETTLPVLIHSGNIEWTTAFTEALDAVNAEAPAYVNLNYIRDLDLGGVHLLSVPGWSNAKYVKPAACRYTKANVDEIRPIAEAAAAKGETVIVTAHGPPRGRGKQALDFADEAGNVGDESLAELLEQVPVRFGLFGHILEAGGRATSDVAVQKPVKLPMRAPAAKLYINAGSSSSYGWQMLNKKTSRGMAALVTFDQLDKGGRAKVVFLTLRK